MLQSNHLIGFGVSSDVVTHRYWQFLKTNGVTGAGPCMEIEMYDAGGLVTITAGMLSQLGMNSFSAANLIDGNTGTTGSYMDSAGIGSYYRVDFGAGNLKAINRARIFGGSPSLGFIGSIQYSDDASSWTTAGTGLDTTALTSAWSDITW